MGVKVPYYMKMFDNESDINHNDTPILILVDITTLTHS